MRWGRGIVLVIAACSPPCSAQSTDPLETTAVNFQTWFQFEGYHPFREGRPWGVFFELQNKSNHGIFDEAGMMVRGGINYDFANRDRLTGGYAFYYNYPYDRAAQPYRWKENRLWQQYYIRRRYGDSSNNEWRLRFRLEERWMQRNAAPTYDQIAGYQFETTLRVQARIQRKLTKKSYWILWDEIYLRMTPEEAERIVDQNRVFVGIGFPMSIRRPWQIEVGYQYQGTWNSVETDPLRKRINHAIRLTISSDAPFRLNK